DGVRISVPLRLLFSCCLYLLTYLSCAVCISFSVNAAASPVLYTLSLHDALPISTPAVPAELDQIRKLLDDIRVRSEAARSSQQRSEEHTSELQSPDHLVCRLLLEKKKNPEEREAQARSSDKERHGVLRTKPHARS